MNQVSSSGKRWEGYEERRECVSGWVSIKEEGAIKVLEVSSLETEMSLVEILKSSKGLDFSEISHIY